MLKTHRIHALPITMMLVAAACTSSGTPATTRPDLDPTTTVAGQEAPPPPGPAQPVENAPTTRATSTTVALTTTTIQPRPVPIEYVVVAEERARRLAVIDTSQACAGAGECELEPFQRIELPQPPHNLTGVGPVVYATHPAAGSVSRIDVATGQVMTVSVGTEPHDIVYAPRLGTMYVADEAGRRLLVVDADTLKVITEVRLPGKPHVLAMAGDTVWITLVGRNELARVIDGVVELFGTSGTPHSLIVDQQGSIWFSNWNSEVLNVFDPTAGTTLRAPAGVSQPHHFAVGPDGGIWVSDNGGGAIVGFGAQTAPVPVGPTPHHLDFIGDTLVVAVSGSGQAVFVQDGEIVARSQLTEGLHGVAVVEIPR